MQHEVLFLSPHFIVDTLNTRAECVRDSLICRKYMFLAKIFALRSMGIQLVPSPHEMNPPCSTWRDNRIVLLTVIPTVRVSEVRRITATLLTVFHIPNTLAIRYL